MKVFCGIDWSERHHDVALVDQDGTLIAKRRIGESVEDFAELLTLLAEAGDSAEEPIPVAIETSRGCWSRPCAPPAARSMPSTRWRSRAIGNGTASRARNPTTSTR
jgi:hypothetical protein